MREDAIVTKIYDIIIDVQFCDNGEEAVLYKNRTDIDEWEYVSEDYEQPEEEVSALNKDVKVGDKIAVTKVNYEELGRVHFAEVVEVYDDFDECIGINPEINGEDTLYMFKGNGDEWRILRDGFEQQHEEESLQHRQAHAYYDDEALSPPYSDAVKAGMTFAEYTGVNITEETLD